MATIKAPYTYTSYSFSEKATRYSQRLSKGKMSWGAAAFFVVTFGVFMLESVIVPDPSSAGAFVLLLLVGLPVGLGIVAAIYAEKLRERYFRGKIRKALEADLARIAETDPVRAAVYRAHLGDILETN